MSGIEDNTVTSRASSTAATEPATDVTTLVNAFKAHEGQNQRLVDVLAHRFSRPHLVEVASISGYDPVVRRPVETTLAQGEARR